MAKFINKSKHFLAAVLKVQKNISSLALLKSSRIKLKTELTEVCKHFTVAVTFVSPTLHHIV